MAKSEDIPEIEEKTEEELEEILASIRESSLPLHVKDFIEKCIRIALWFPHILLKKNISLNRLKRMIFGKGYKSSKGKADNASNQGNTSDADKAKADSDAETKAQLNAALTTTGEIETAVNDKATESEPTAPNDTEKKPGHGRMPHTVYQEFTEVFLAVSGRKSGDSCPNLCSGKVYKYEPEPEKPKTLVRIRGRNFADVTKYIVEQLRCNLCHEIFQADIPAEVGKDKYDASFKAWLILQKYFVAVPFYRQETFQRMIGFPLTDSTQWDLVEQAAGYCYQVFSILMLYAANGKLIHNDDTSVRIQEVIAELKANPNTERRGMFTSGFIAQYQAHKIALFFNGTSHAGENLEKILKQRESTSPPIIQMCDALNCNLAKEVETIVCNCLSHGFRKFDELVDYFPTPCITIMKLLSQVYDNDALTKDMDDNARLAYHQAHSRPIMNLLKQYMQALLDEKQVEPNSELGKAIKYMRNHWKKLSRFLMVAGAPLCNNVVERALKIAIRNRKAAMFYRTRYSAHIGGMLTSLIYTCSLAKENPHHYLTALQDYAHDVRKEPHQWLPWNYKASLKSLHQEVDANPSGCGPPQDAPVAV